MDAHGNDAGGQALRPARRRRRWYQAPLLHFLGGGALLFAARDGRTLVGTGAPPVVITAAEVAQLRSDYERDTGLAATDSDEAALVDKAIDEELLVREAFARGLDRHDRSIRAWLVEQMEALGEQGDPDRLHARAVALGLDRSDLVVRRILLHKIRLLLAKTEGVPPTAADLRAFWASHRDEYRAPDVTTFWHVFFARGSRGARAAPDARVALGTIEARGLPPAEAVGLGDPFATTLHVERQAASRTATVFGPAFAAGLGTAPVGRWAGPIGSSHGEHLVLVESRDPGAVPAFEDVRDRVVARWRDEQRRARVAALVRRLRADAFFDVASEPWRRSRS